MRLAFVVAVIALSVLGFAQASFAGKRRYPQTRTISGLSGGGAAIMPNGSPSVRGALALSTPIGYTISPRNAVLTGSATSADGSLRWFDGDVAENGSNGTASVMFGVEVGSTIVGTSIVQTSRLSEDRVVNLQATLVSSGRTRLAVGVQDLFDDMVTTPDYGHSSQTCFAAATYSTHGVYTTIGGGTKRFADGFASVSAPLVRGTRGMIEHDGFGWNYGVQVSLFDTSSSQASLFYGFCQGRYATWALSWQF